MGMESRGQVMVAQAKLNLLPHFLSATSLKHLVGLIGELPQSHHSLASHPSSVANAAAITSALQVGKVWL